MEPHEPYDRGRAGRLPRARRYLSEVAVATTRRSGVFSGLLAAERVSVRLMGALRELEDPTARHSASTARTQHGKTLYEELLHVPLLVRAPLFAARIVEERVGLVDLDATILDDLFRDRYPRDVRGAEPCPASRGGRRRR